MGDKDARRPPFITRRQVNAIYAAGKDGRLVVSPKTFRDLYGIAFVPVTKLDEEGRRSYAFAERLLDHMFSGRLALAQRLVDDYELKTSPRQEVPACPTTDPQPADDTYYGVEDVMERFVRPALGPSADEYDLECIALEVMEWSPEKHAWVVDPEREDFYEIAIRHESEIAER